MQKREIAYGIVALALIGSSATLGWLYNSQLNENNQLRSQLHSMEQQVKRSAIIRNISTQMEQIAYQQKDVSDEQRIQAVRQTEIANQMRLQSEVARKNALQAQAAAQASEARAVEASHLAEHQQKLAEQRQLQAEYAQRVSDTLSYISLARALGNMSTTQYNAGNKDIAACLATVAYNFNQRYQGDVYQPAIFRALSLSCESDESWNLHQGALTAIVDDPTLDGHFFTVDTYGGIMEHQLDNNGRMDSHKLIENSTYDFRDACISSDGTLFALSRSGDLFVHPKSFDDQVIKVGSDMKRMSLLDDGSLVILGDKYMASVDTKSLTVSQSMPLSFKISTMGLKDNIPMIFDESGNMYEVKNDLMTKDLGMAPSTAVFGSGTVSAYAFSTKYQLAAYGTTNGDILLVDAHGVQRKLVGHRSRISQLAFHGARLYSSSFDGTVNFWQTDAARIDPMNIHTGSNWIQCFALDKEASQVWTGDYMGYLSQTYISAPQMARLIQQSLKRNLTKEEWKFYMGNNIPYENIK